jgi:hypothetical protein
MIPDEYPLSEPFRREQTEDEPLYNSTEIRIHNDWESQATATLETRFVPVGYITPLRLADGRKHCPEGLTILKMVRDTPNGPGIDCQGFFSFFNSFGKAG